MGYFGFGLQKWIYKQRPRKPFSNNRKPSHDTTPIYHNEFKLKRDLNVTNNKLKAFITLLFLAGIVWAIVIMLSNAKSRTSEYNQEFNKTIERTDNEIFNVLYKSGSLYYRNESWESAKSEFERALKIKPDHIDLNRKYITTLLFMANSDSTYRKSALNYINKLIIKYPDQTEFKSMKKDLFGIDDI